MMIQLIDVTLKYRQYKTNIKSDIKYFEEGNFPAMTLCRKDADWKFVRKTVNKTNNVIYYQFQYLIGNKTDKKQIWVISFDLQSWETELEIPWLNHDYYSLITDIIFTNISSFKCVTFFSKLQLKSARDLTFKLKKTMLVIKINDYKHLNYYFSIHPANQIISSISTNNIILNSFNYIFNLNPKTEYLLPPPYDTNCVNYGDNVGKQGKHRSMKECERN